ncbi:hydroxyethylthiazole kinase [Rhodoferax sp.]|uniref:hydroxyethylthiazole kinase n=1 Tax=Rhodoferax sp. TaxID=50421 RepID=UPI002730A6BA|nr:hydroxyethylthiazole kinase [Rhodoferax sp.]MDP1531678.1 hydroxyethylthiazole kinase [Rhodoferax sp.]MDP1944235.1 hydroxyethylthiazole kinase [Rhodoferax sp.]MDP2441112.1 hydroxyethylthiazole kinase [Rhodoferax sp.]MDZ4209438.1 hydroxyethylthiazole kinase [Rhodoferax sp.]
MAKQASPLLPSDLWADVLAVRARRPLVHSITNLVVMNFNANVLLAMGASPVMAHAHEEVADMAAIAQALVLNIGTLEPYWINSMCQALDVATARGIPTVLDPVGAGATRYRNESIQAILRQAMPSVIRGNASEIMSVAGTAAKTRGVDSGAAVADALQAARDLAQRSGGVVCVSGPVDQVLDASGRHASLANGHEWMTRITGVGCSATALVGAFCAVQPDAWRATVSAMAYLGVVGEVAARQVQAQGQGVGSLQIALLDQLQLLDEATFVDRLKLSVSA